ncbi:hypothetical protein HHK36_001995 [Tetracentron sinense]|uniref:Uncharacterized protein n=1 Tax=Tetracentron sinense TaxID=13715 RepID=A0A834ZX97_TETSI|nr:hypothetical protein HHK36_001995 [Tetracentron sinense]
MLSLKPCKRYFQPPFLFNPSKLQKQSRKLNQGSCNSVARKVVDRRKLVVRGCQEGGGEKKKERQSFLTLEEAGLVEISGLGTHERFLCRLTISSLNLLRVIAEQEGFPIEELNAGRICDWFVKDKLKREQNLESAFLKYDFDGLQ